MGVLDKFLDAIKLNDDYDDYDDDQFFDEEDDFADEKPRKRFFKKLEEEEEYEEPRPIHSYKRNEKTMAKQQSKQPKVTTSSKVTPMRSAKKQGKVMEVCVIKPTTMEDTREIADTLIANCTVVLNLEGLDVDVAQRIIDFTSGSCYSIGGNLQKISSYIFILTPANVDITGDHQGLLNGGFDMPSIHTDF